MAKSKKARKIRKRREFDLQDLLRTKRPPTISTAAYSWDLAAIMGARDEQISGRFSQPSRLAISMRTDDALMVAYKNRIAPQRSLAVAVEPGKGPRAGSIASEAEPQFGNEGIAVTSDVLADINGDLANHGVAIGYNLWNVRDDGSRVDVLHNIWPLEYVYYDSIRCSLMTTSGAMGGQLIEPIIHGNGRWVVYSTHSLMPWRQDAAILPGSLVWAGHALAARDWNRGSSSHGNAKVVGELPEGVSLQELNDDGDAVVSRQAASFLALLEDIASLDTPVGIKPPGANIEYLVNSSRAWEVWERLMLNREKAAARIYLGTDGTLGAAGGAPGVDISELFNIATTIMQGDLGAITRGLRTGVIEPWCAWNFGDSAAAPIRRYLVPDADQERTRDERVKRETEFCNAINSRRDAGLVVSQDWIDALADTLGVPRADLAATQASGIVLAPTDVARVISVDEARASVGLPVDPKDGPKKLAELETKAEAEADVEVVEAEAEAEPDKPKLRSA